MQNWQVYPRQRNYLPVFRRRNVEETWEAYTQLRHSSIKLTRTEFRHTWKFLFSNTTITAFAPLQPVSIRLDIEIVMVVLRRMESAKIMPNSVLYNTLVNVAAHLLSPATEFLAIRITTQC
ncbi:1464_t:CDS:2 [Paraglomus occultum]|uniref:1464_t:CDS:1 n=1 Tax=Paraglomus occultum TaxID=144539 RepID=A0A9N8VVT5_9GLOM|nr:1464_t:CDS:2 [Paraglomus occultum]